MAVNVDTVYQRVLAIANKEQRGYITPQEFNLFANQAQMNIFEQYFYDLNQFGRLPGNDSDYADAVTILEEKIALFEFNADPGYINAQNGFTPAGSATGFRLPPEEVYRLGTVRLNNVDVDVLTTKDFKLAIRTPLGQPTLDRPIAHRTGEYISIAYNVSGNGTLTYARPHLAGSPAISMDYIRRPSTAIWGYNVIQEKAMYEPSNSNNFDLHPSEEVELVNKILILAGITIKSTELYQAAVAEDTKNLTQEKR